MPRPADGRGLVPLPTQVALDRGQRATEPAGDALQALVRMGAAEAYDLVVVDRPLAADDTGQAVEVLRLDLDPEPGPDLASLPLRRPGHETGDVVVDDGAVEAGGEQRAGGADLGGLGSECRVLATHPRRRADDRLGLEGGVQEHLGDVGARGAIAVLASRPGLGRPTLGCGGQPGGGGRTGGRIDDGERGAVDNDGHAISKGLLGAYGARMRRSSSSIGSLRATEDPAGTFCCSRVGSRRSDTSSSDPFGVIWLSPPLAAAADRPDEGLTGTSRRCPWTAVRICGSLDGLAHGQRPTHLLQLRAGRHLLGEEGGLDAVEQTLEPARRAAPGRSAARRRSGWRPR